MSQSTGSKRIHNPHDSAFKAAMKNIHVAEEFFEVHLPEKVKKLILPGSYRLENNSYVDNQLNQSSSDVLYSVKLADPQGKGAPRDGFIYVLVEAQTNPDKFLSWRMLGYMVRIVEEYRAQISSKKESTQKLPNVFPIIFYTGQKPYCYPIDLPSVFEFPDLAIEIFTKDFQFIDLKRLDDKDLMRHSSVGLLEMVYSFSDNDFGMIT